MFLTFHFLHLSSISMLHARGDVSTVAAIFINKKLYAPRTWRCFFISSTTNWLEKVCSTHVEMFPSTIGLKNGLSGMLHARGDVSASAGLSGSQKEYAPRTWRCFILSVSLSMYSCVCSTHVEMFPKSDFLSPEFFRMLHARGDVSIEESAIVARVTYAPRTWRCF